MVGYFVDIITIIMLSGRSVDIITGIILGKGSFCTVKEVKEIHLDYSTSDTTSISSDHTCNTTETRDNIDETYKPDEVEYAIKQVRKDLTSTHLYGARIDLRKEAEFLRTLRHRNIISIQ